ncbi:MAG: histidine kinase dimerization/phospho-acceptor domain-containing protein, partial [Alphaproteobacteria bacterium]
SAALTIIRDTIRQEGELQRAAMLQAHHTAELEFAVALTALLILPVIALAMLIYVRRRSFHSINQLSLLLDNVGNLDFRTAEPAGADDPLASVYERYNDMAEKLRLASKEAQDRETRLERQVRAASETLLRQQAELENGAHLAAIGEFSARMAHELRNPISGISVALHNLERELEDNEPRERIALIAEEMERVTKLLNGLLERGRIAPEIPSAIETRALVNDVVRLFGYRLPETTEIVTDVEDWTCHLPRDTFRQVLINLLKNSSEAIGEAPGIIRVTMRRDGNISILTVSDNGPGFSEERWCDDNRNLAMRRMS